MRVSEMLIGQVLIFLYALIECLICFHFSRWKSSPWYETVRRYGLKISFYCVHFNKQCRWFVSQQRAVIGSQKVRPQ